jgi:hypothetical protein
LLKSTLDEFESYREHCCGFDDWIIEELRKEEMRSAAPVMHPIRPVQIATLPPQAQVADRTIQTDFGGQVYQGYGPIPVQYQGGGLMFGPGQKEGPYGMLGTV